MVLGSACASRPAADAGSFGPVTEQQRAPALAAWSEALRRAESLPPSRLLYEARFGQRSVRVSGTLAVVATPESLKATATGPFGSSLAQYENGALRVKGREPLFLDPDLLRGALAGIWKSGPPTVAGSRGADCLLRWEAPGVTAEAVFDVAAARVKSLRVENGRADVSVAFSGSFDPWPQIVELSDAKSGQRLRLKRVAVEPIRD